MGAKGLKKVEDAPGPASVLNSNPFSRMMKQSQALNSKISIPHAHKLKCKG